MVSLVARTPAQGLLPLQHGSARLSEVEPGPVTAVLPYRGRSEALGKALEACHGLALPAPGRSTAGDTSRCLWFGKEQVLLAGVVPDSSLAEAAALTDQSDAWAWLALEGGAAEDVLARLVPLDLRSRAFPEGACVRTMLKHLNVGLARTGPERFEIIAFRSMARTLVHDLETAMKDVAARP